MEAHEKSNEAEASLSQFNTKNEIEFFVLNTEACMKEKKWKCVENHALNLIQTDEPTTRAFGSWAMGVSSLEKKELGVAYRYFGLAVRDNPYRYTFQKWFALSAFSIRQFSIAQKHIDWALQSPEGTHDFELKSLSLRIKHIIHKDTTPVTPRKPASTDGTIDSVWVKTLDSADKKICAEMGLKNEKPAFCP